MINKMIIMLLITINCFAVYKVEETFGNYTLNENKMYLEMTRFDDDKYKTSLVIEEQEINGYIIDKANLRVNYESTDTGISSLDLYNAEFGIEYGFVCTDGFLTLSVDLIYWFENESINREEKLDIGNTIRLGIYY